MAAKQREEAAKAKEARDAGTKFSGSEEEELWPEPRGAAPEPTGRTGDSACAPGEAGKSEPSSSSSSRPKPSSAPTPTSKEDEEQPPPAEEDQPPAEAPHFGSKKEEEEPKQETKEEDLGEPLVKDEPDWEEDSNNPGVAEATYPTDEEPSSAKKRFVALVPRKDKAKPSSAPPSSPASNHLRELVQKNKEEADRLAAEVRSNYLACPPEEPPPEPSQRPVPPADPPPPPPGSRERLTPPPPPEEWHQKVARKRAASAGAKAQADKKLKERAASADPRSRNSFQPLADEEDTWRQTRRQLHAERVDRRSARAPGSQEGGSSASSSWANPANRADLVPSGTPAGDGSLWEEVLFDWKPNYSPIKWGIRDERNRVSATDKLDPRLVALDWNQTIAFPKKAWVLNEETQRHQYLEVSHIPEESFQAIKRLVLNDFIVQVVSYIGLEGPESKHRRAELPKALKTINDRLFSEVGVRNNLPIHCRIVDSREEKIPYIRSEGCHTIVDDNRDICGDGRSWGCLTFLCARDKRFKAGWLSSVVQLHTLETAVEGIVDAREQGWHLSREARESYSWTRKA